MANCNYKVKITDIQNKYKFKIFSAPRGEKGEKGDTGDVSLSQLNEEKNARENADINLQSQITGLASGSPLVASSVSGMTDTTRIYVNTTDGHWYYYDGSAWQDGGVYQATEIEIDKSLTQTGVSADAKTTGDFINILNDTLLDNEYKDYEMSSYSANQENVERFHLVQNMQLTSSGKVQSSTALILGYLYIQKPCKVYFKGITSTVFRISIVDGANPYNLWDTTTGQITGTQTTRIEDKTLLPTTEETAYQLNPGQVLYIQIGKQNQSSSQFLVTNYFINNKLNNNIILNTNQLNQATKKFNVVYNSSNDEFNIYMPFKQKLLKFTIPHTINSNKAQNIRRINQIDITDLNKNVLYSNLTSNADIDGVVKINNESDFIGGYHGYETINSLILLIDGKEYSLSNDIDENCDEIEFIMYSTVYDHSNVASFNRIKQLLFKNNKLEIFNKWFSLVSATLNKIYFGMMETKLNYNSTQFTLYGLNNKNYVKTDLSTTENQPANSFFAHTDENNEYEVWGTNIYYKIGVDYYDTIDSNNYDSHGVLYDSGPKCYIGNDNAFNITPSSVLKGKTTIEFNLFN